MNDPNPIDSGNGDHRLAFLSWQPEESRKQHPTPVTLFSGFLGAGKTTLLRHLLAQQGEKSIALVINDVGEVNMDAAQVQRDLKNQDQSIELLQELTQGCICCSIGDELADALVYLQEKGQPDEIWIEASGISNPRNILSTFYMANIHGHTLVDAFALKNIITVVDAGLFASEWSKTEQSPYIELITDQLETCDAIVLNKLDRVSPDELRKVYAIVEAHNPRAERFSCTEGNLESDLLLGPARFDLQPTQRGSTVYCHLEKLPDHQEDAPHHHDHQHPFQTVFFQSRLPVNEELFLHALETRLPNVVRAKGFFFTSDQPGCCSIVSLAGGILRAEPAGMWYVDLVEAGKASMEEMPPEVQAAWKPLPLGDRRQEIVLIGVDLVESEVLDILSSCLKPIQDNEVRHV